MVFLDSKLCGIQVMIMKKRRESVFSSPPLFTSSDGHILRHIYLPFASKDFKLQSFGFRPAFTCKSNQYVVE